MVLVYLISHVATVLRLFYPALILLEVGTRYTYLPPPYQPLNYLLKLSLLYSFHLHVSRSAIV
jgi:hypothetical protein